MRPRTWARAWWAWREYARGAAWARRAARLGHRLSHRASYAAILTSGPPHMAHEAGRLLANKLEIPLALDLRDLWSLVQRLPERWVSPVWYRLARRYERRCVQEARLIALSTEPAAEAMREAYPEATDRIIAVMNGYDDDPLPAPTDGERFLITYAGSIYLDRDPRPLFKAVRRVIGARGLRPSDLRVEFIGNVNDYGGVPLRQMAREEDIEEYVRTRTFLPRRDTLALLARATMLVSLPQDSDLAIPSKVFEYLRFPAWILAMTEPGSATGEILRHTHADVIPPGDVEAMADAIDRRYREFREVGRPSPAAEAGEQHLSRRRQGNEFLEHLERHIAPAS